ncbi:hypothetical protein QLX67_12630, partial [Balneolaceae bacterium ANBcel3]|nr:hypothetical protein [Balneolaceae bacterium ANBcel3]
MGRYYNRRIPAILILLSGIVLFNFNAKATSRDFPENPSHSEEIAQILTEKYREHFAELLKYQKEFRDMHPLFEAHYPITIAVDDHFFVFDLDASNEQYEFVKSVASEMPLPEGLRAAFPLDFYDEKPAVVVSGDIFKERADFAVIFHEFVHCYQWNTVEPLLRENLPLAVESMKRGDFMWEINYPFPYRDKKFEELYGRFLEALYQGGSDEEIMVLRESIREVLDDVDYQYMIWQEWKEGMALFFENRIRARMQLPENRVGRSKPFDRT